MSLSTSRSSLRSIFFILETDDRRHKSFPVVIVVVVVAACTAAAQARFASSHTSSAPSSHPVCTSRTLSSSPASALASATSPTSTIASTSPPRSSTLSVPVGSTILERQLWTSRPRHAITYQLSNGLWDIRPSRWYLGISGGRKRFSVPVVFISDWYTRDKPSRNSRTP